MKIIAVDDERIALSGLELILYKAVPPGGHRGIPPGEGGAGLCLPNARGYCFSG